MQKLSSRRVNHNKRRLRRTNRRFTIRRILQAKRKLRIKDRVYKIPHPMPQVKATKAILDPYNETHDLILRNLSDRSQLTYTVDANTIGNWLTVSPMSGTIGTESFATLALTADETGLTQGFHFDDFTIQTNGGDIVIRAITSVGVPDADPSGLTFSFITATKMTVGWTNNCTNETEVRIYQAQANIKPVSPTYTEAAGTNYKVIAQLSPGVTYYFWIEFANLDGVSNHLTGSQATLDPPNANPTNMTFSHITASTIYVHWTNVCTNATEVRFWHSPINVQPALYDTLSATATEKQLYSGLNAGTTYYFWVQFVNNDGTSTTLTGSQATAGAGNTPTTYLNEIFDGTTNGYNQVPSNWASPTMLNGIVFPGVPKSVLATRSWSCDAYRTPSSTTGPSSGHDSTASDGREGSSLTDFMYTEVSGQYSKRFLLRTPQLDFSNSLSNNTLELTFWFHMYGANIGSLGVAATTSATSAGSNVEAASGTGFTSDTAGGMTMVYWDDNSDDGSSTSSGVRITGQQQTAGNGSTSVDAHWRKATVDLNALAGESSVYIWFFAKSGTSWRGDICIDDVQVVGEE